MSAQLKTAIAAATMMVTDNVMAWPLAALQTIELSVREADEAASVVAAVWGSVVELRVMVVLMTTTTGVPVSMAVAVEVALPRTVFTAVTVVFAKPVVTSIAFAVGKAEEADETGEATDDEEADETALADVPPVISNSVL